MRIYGTILLVCLLFVNIIGLKYVAKTGIIFLMVVLLSIFSMYIGIFTQGARDPPSLPDIEPRYQYASGLTGLSREHWIKN